MPATSAEADWQAYPHYGRSGTTRTKEDGSHDGRSIWKTLGKSLLLQGRLCGPLRLSNIHHQPFQLLIQPRVSLTETLTHSALILSHYFETTPGGEGSGSINP